MRDTQKAISFVSRVRDEDSKNVTAVFSGHRVQSFICWSEIREIVAMMRSSVRRSELIWRLSILWMQNYELKFYVFCLKFIHF